MGLLQLLAKLFGKSYLNKIMGTRTNVAKPIQMDKSSPFKRYSNSAYDDPEIVELIEKKIDEYGPYALNNKNPQELANFEDNAKRLLEAKNKQTGTTPGMQKAMEPKPEAEMFGFETKQKLDDQGIMTLKEDMGLPPDVAPDSPMGKILTSRNKINQQFKGMGKAAQDIAAKSYSTAIEGKRRAAMRQILLRDNRIKLPREVEVSLEDMKDLGKNADPNMDPLVLFDKYYKRDNKKLEMLDGIIDESLNPVDAADSFLVKDDTIELLDDDLGTKLKDYDGDPDGLANGGRPGYAYGTGLKLISLLSKQGTNIAKEIKRSLDNIFPTGDAKYDADVMVDEIMENLDIDRDAVDGFDISDLYGKAYDALTKQTFNAKKLMQSVNQKGKGTVTTADNIPQPTKTLKSIEDTGSIDISNDEVAEEFANFMKRNDPEGYEKLEGITDKINSKTRTDNAEGGRIGMLAGGSVLKLMLQNMAKERGVKPSSLLELMNIKSLPKEIRDRLSPKEIKEFLDKRLEQVKNFKDMMETKLNFNQAIDKGKNLNEGLTSDIFEYFDDTFSKNNPVPRSVDEKSVLEMEQMIKNMEMKDRKLNAQGGLNYLMGL